MNEKTLIEYFRKIGFTENEAKAYIGLVTINEATARELHEYTDIPRAKIYDILKNLVGKGYAEIRHGSPTYYRPADPEELIKKLKNEYMEIFSEIRTSLEKIHYEKEEVSPIWYLKSEWPIVKRGRGLIESTKKDLVIITKNVPWLMLFKEELRETNKKAKVMIFAEDPDQYKDLGIPVHKNEVELHKFHDYLSESADNIDNKKGILMISDATTGLFIENNGGKMEGIYLTHRLITIIYQTIIFMNNCLDSVIRDENTLKITLRKPKE